MIKLSDKEKALLHKDRIIKFRYDLLNNRDIKKGELNSVSGSINFNSLAGIKRTGKFSIRDNEFKNIDFLNDRIQPYMLVKDGDIWREYSLGIFLISSPNQNFSSGKINRNLEAYDSSLILKQDKFTSRHLIKKGSNYINEITKILNDSGIWKINIENHPGRLKNDKEFEIGQEKLTVINDLLKEINYTSLWVDELGYFNSKPYVLPNLRGIDYEYKNDELSIIKSNSFNIELDLFDVPNSWVVVASNPEIEEPFVSRYTNDSSNSLTSTVNRGRTIVDYREIDDILDQKTLDDYIKRIAYESSDVFGKISFTTGLMPHHGYMDNLFIEHDELNIANKYIETSWGMDLQAGGDMYHNARRVISI